jgi:hypothetical protein
MTTTAITAPSIRTALIDAIFAMETVRNLRGIKTLTPYIERAKAALAADASKEA